MDFLSIYCKNDKENKRREYHFSATYPNFFLNHENASSECNKSEQISRVVNELGKDVSLNYAQEGKTLWQKTQGGQQFADAISFHVYSVNSNSDFIRQQ